MIERHYKIFLISIIVIAMVLRISRLDRMALWGDEACMVFLCGETPADIVKALASSDRPDVDVAPPLYFLLLHFWLKLFGSSIVAFRSFSVLFGVLIIYAVLRLGESLFDRKTALLAALFTALHPFQIWYSQEGRMYSLATFLGVCSLWGFARAFRNPEKWQAWIPLALAGIALIYTQYYGMILLGSMMLYAVFRIARHPGNRRIAAACLIGVLFAWLAAFGPWIPVLLRDYLHAGAPGGFPLMFDGLKTPVFLFAKYVLFGLENYVRDHLWLYPLPLFASLVACIAAFKRPREEPVHLLVTAFLLPFAIIYLLSLAGMRVYKSHPFIIFHPAFIVLIAHGCLRLRSIHRNIVIAVIGAAQVFVLGTLVLGGDYVKPRIDDVVKWIDSRAVDDSAVSVVPAFVPNPLPIVGDLLAFRYHSDDRFDTQYLTGSTPDDLLHSIDRHGIGRSSFFLVYQDNFQIEAVVEKVLQGLEGRWKILERAEFPSRNRGFSMVVIRYGSRSL